MIIPATASGNAPSRMSSPPAISVHQVSHFFGSNPVLNHVNLSVPEGTILALLGPSGCGKSTLLKMLAGLLHPASGQISFDGVTVASGKISLPPEKRNLGMAFQDYALWPHMTVRQNVAFPLQMRGIRGAIQQEKVMAALERVGLADFVSRRPAELSGGQQQRVALARAIVAEPRILLFDEPLSNLDRDLRESLCEEMATLLRQLGTTAVYVTHDQHEAHALAHRIARMDKGAIASIDQIDPSVVSPFVA
ncbi:ABC transporter ATP-binding protein [Rahnella aquatilis]|jgi:iron(III) transport system ATP-binding protein|uniref:ABC transporter ATP-binding protein n=1 Tax=Rahnella sp. (strain Y9602) TaxID=2703885 RepID=A0ABW6CJX9_RAHSY|nr:MULTISPECIES: ABC transporter ATP-binding protein [Rahnella]AZP42241.1 ABC transporter ATP-binding protein [Rahnella aquatilis]AZP46581.1 ABC transporter ATP-binding protein [Rahnella aquatilis]MBU9840869.1 ABC transporter ATP-binding protein [Rahnella aceris]MBU9865884.1 ABC transporter ATP-binding protein [Rahnella aceris]MQB53067.1 ATP-binding cassette domain-containing protein [Rahnella sp. RcJ3]